MKLIAAILAACLAVAVARDSLIIDGREAQKGDFPTLVSLQRFGSHFCGGTLVDKRTVVTAAHCFFGRDSDTTGFTAVAGINNLRETSDSDRQSYDISNIILHPNYKSQSHFVSGDDIAILKLSRDVVETDYIKFVSLPSQGQDIPASGTDCQVVGWGAIDPPGQSAHFKKMIGDVKSITNTVCALTFIRTLFNGKQVCAGGESTTNACRGDSGGPLFCEGNQIGIVSYGRVPCGNRGVPTVYARVATYRDWISENSG